MNQGKNKSYKYLQNGSDIRGVAIISEDFDLNSDLVQSQNLLARYGEEALLSLSKSENSKAKTLTTEVISDIAHGFYKWLSNKTRAKTFKIAIGHDSRLSAPKIKETLIDAFLIRENVIIFDAGLASTPAMFMATKFMEYDCDAAIMITASHLPYDRNGFKFFTKEGGLNKKDISEILNYAEENGNPDVSRINSLNSGEEELSCALEEKNSDKRKKIDLIDTYSEYLCDKIKEEVSCNKNYDIPLANLHIVVDAGNGAGGFFANKILRPLGANVRGSQFLEPDGLFPNHIPNPEDDDAMASICKAVIDNNADLGIIFDTDVDRISAVDRMGNPINRNSIIALAASLVVGENPKTTIVTDSITSVHLTDYLEEHLGVAHLRYMRGYKNVINKAIDLNEQGIDSQLAIETSGHAAFKENFFLDDGAYLAIKIVIKAAKLAQENTRIDSILEPLNHPIEKEEIRFQITEDDFISCGDKALLHLENWTNKNQEEYNILLTNPNYEGVRVEFRSADINGWALLRKSLHDPIMVLNIECNELNGLVKMKKMLLDCFSETIGINFTNFER